ncbi:brain-specific angiogenesis inhibitor 1-associated protein 2-like protein 2 isoform X2 [Brienomyrus brachyistius]|uniref:brain-specific angiogenesis inhibitor 1-associated protein 2-like protein 2 isoform X2 n=1 Tax=Brienomyrus brachyistius TaxID=42636 RepID=UPI0020B4148A|nr:brain-specific angiogenesis inhibitor 1-associated protein 2-like protein 2 isoform X2 [Brienomyrus brachyistius]
MSGQSSDHVHRSTLGVYANILDQFNPGLQKLVGLGNSYVQAFQALAVTSKAYFDALAKMGEQALRSSSSYSLGDILIEISENQRRLMAELEAVFRWFHTDVLQEMDSNIKMDKDYISACRRRYEMEVRCQAAALEKQLKRGSQRNTQSSSSYMQFLWQNQQEALKEEERRFQFLAEKHCGLTQSMLYLLNKTGSVLQQRAERWREHVVELRGGRPRTVMHVDPHATVGGRESDGACSQATRGQQPWGVLPSRGSSLQSVCSASCSPAASSGLNKGRPVRALVSHDDSANPTLLPFSQGQVVTVLVSTALNGWLYGRVEGGSRLGWFPAAYVQPLEDGPEDSNLSASNFLQVNIGSSQDAAPPPALLPAQPPAPPPAPPPSPPPAPRLKVTTSPVRKAESTTPSKAKRPYRD